jgi:PGF-CTERM protein
VTVLLIGVLAVALLAGGAAAAGAIATDAAGDTADRAPAAVGVGPAAADAGDGSLASRAAQDGEDPLVESCAAEMPADYADPAGGTAGTIGFVDGYWYDEPIDVTASDGLSEAELERLTARTAARAEALRCLAFVDGVPPVEVISRETYTNQTGQQYANVSADASRFDNAMLSTMLLVGETNDSVDVREESRSQTVAGYYSITGDRIVVIERPGEGIAVDETVLTHEIAHALQDQHFRLERPGNVTMDRDNGLLGLIEGDASWVENRYLDRCEAERWEQSCVTLESDGGGGSGGGSAPPNWGLYLEQYQPYSDGPAFVRGLFREGDWPAVNETYPEPPSSALYVMSPDTYGEVDLVEPAVENASRGEWERLTIEGAPNYETPGPAGIGGMVIAPTYEYGAASGVVSPREFLNYDADDNLSEFDPLDYAQPPVDGWRGGRLAVFENADNDSATVWRTAWADDGEAAEFAEAYRQILRLHEAEAVDGRDGAFRFTAESDHTGAVGVAVEGDRVRIVAAPTVEELTRVSPNLDLANESDGGDGSGDGGSGDGDGSDDGGSSDDSLPGFGLIVALLGALGGALLAARRGR